MYRQWVHCERNSSYYFIPIFFKLCTCFLHCLKMCMWFACNPYIICFTFSTLRFFSFSDLRLYESVVTVGTLWAQLLIQFYTNLFETLHMFPHGLKMCMWFGYNPWINFVTFSTLCTLSFSDHRPFESEDTGGTLWAQLLIQFYTYIFETLHMFLPWSGDVHMVWI